MAEWDEQIGALQQDLPCAPQGARQQVLSADGAMVPLVGGEWAEVKTLVLGQVSRTRAGDAQIEQLSYCSRLGDVAEFEQATLLEVHRRGLEHAEQVAAVTDGADWLQGFIDYHRADAVRILDFAHAAEYVAAIGEAVRAAGYRVPSRWQDGVLHRLKHEGPDRVLVHLARLARRCPDAEVGKKLQYLCTRRAQLLYPSYQAAGWPIGSGIVESANKLVVQARLKGAGMHWKRETVNPMLLLRNAVCNDRWSQTWQGRRKQEQQRRQRQRAARTHARLTQATARLFRLCFLLGHFPRHDPLPVERLPAVAAPSPTAPVPKGRTDAQYRWGRRPVSPQGVRLQAQFAKL